MIELLLMVQKSGVHQLVGSLSHDSHGWKNIPGGDRRISEPSTVSIIVSPTSNQGHSSQLDGPITGRPQLSDVLSNSRQQDLAKGQERGIRVPSVALEVQPATIFVAAWWWIQTSFTMFQGFCGFKNGGVETSRIGFKKESVRPKILPNL